MKIAIISDTHDNLATLDKFLAYIKENPVGAVIHCGDIADGGTLKHLAENFPDNILAVFGNMDYRESVENAAKKYPGRIQLFKNFGQAEIGGLRIGFCHFPEIAKTRAKESDFDFVFYGHTHKPWQEQIGSCRLANPGTLAGMFYQATFAVLDASTRNLELKIVSRLHQKTSP
jgi:hypothetical protein